MAIKAPPGKAGRTTVPDGGPATRGPAARPPARGNEALGREIGTAFYRIFPALIIIVGLALVVMVALWAVNPGTTASPSTGNGATLPTGNGMVEANGTVVNVNLTAVETDQTIVPAAAGVPAVVYHVWTFDGTAPGPVIRVHLGDTVQFTIHNATTMGMQHSIDFHAAMTPWANLPAAVGFAHGVMAAWKSIECCMPIVVALWIVNCTVSPRCTLMTGPGAVPSKVHTWYTTAGTPAAAGTMV